MPNTEFCTFPSTKTEALTMLYLQNQDLHGKSPDEIFDMYDEAYQTIRNYSKEKRKRLPADTTF